MCKNHTSNFSVLVLYWMIFAIFYISYPLNNSLIESFDALYHVAIFNFFKNEIVSFFTGEDMGQFFYGDRFPGLNGEPTFGNFIIWLGLKMIFRSDVFTYYFLLVTILSLNSFSLFILLSKVFNVGRVSSWIGGVFFGFNMFVFANIESINTLTIYPLIFCVYYFYKILFKSKGKFEFLFFVIFASFQLATCVYNCIYLLIILLVCSIYNYRFFFRSIISDRMKWLWSISFLAVFYFVYLWLIVILPDKSNTHWNFSQNKELVKIFSITLDDFFRTLPDTLYGSQVSISKIEMLQSFFSGFVFSFLVLLGILNSPQFRWLSACIIGVMFLFGVGTYIDVQGEVILLPLGWLFEKFDIYGFLRLPYRLYFPILLILIVYAVFELEKIQTYKFGKLILGICTILYLVENIPFKRTYENFDVYRSEGEYLKEITKGDSLILFLPVSDIMYGEGIDYRMNETGFINMYWQTMIKKNIINGNSGFIPQSVVELNELIYKSHDVYDSLLKYCNKYGVDKIIYYDETWNFYKNVLNYDQLKKYFEANNSNIQIVFRSRN